MTLVGLQVLLLRQGAPAAEGLVHMVGPKFWLRFGRGTKLSYGPVKDASPSPPGDGDFAESDTLREFAAGQKLFDRYALEKVLGRGGMGIVWLARDEELEREVALKFLPELVVRDRAVLSDLKRETRRSLELTHRHIVRIYDFVQDDRSGCISMEFVDGDTLSNLRADRKRKVFEPSELADWTSQLCDALDYAHNHARIIHRDLKPANLMVNRRGDLKITDFGIARSLSDSISALTMQRGKSGTLVYMSPQQLDGERSNHLDDIYSLGATLYELLTSKPPFYTGNVDRQIREKPAPSMTQRRKELEIDASPLPAPWEEAVAACLEKEPARRPQSVRELAERLGLTSPQPGTSKAASPGRPRRKALAVALVMVSLAVAAGGWYMGVWFLAQQTPQASMVRIDTENRQKDQTAAAGTEAPEQTASPTAAGEMRQKQQEQDHLANARGSALLQTLPEGATATPIGMGAEKPPATFKEMRPGKYPLGISLDGYESTDKEVEAHENRPTDSGTITPTQISPAIDITTTPPGAKVLQAGNPIGTTPYQRDSFPVGDATFVLFLEGYLPLEFNASVTPKKPLQASLTLVKPATKYTGTIHVKNDSAGPGVPLLISLEPDLKSGTMTQSSRRGEDTVVKFNGEWEGAILHAVTDEVLAEPQNVKWSPESFTLRFSDDGQTASYECHAEKTAYVAELTPQRALPAKAASIYKGTIHTKEDSRSSGVPLTIKLEADRKSGTMTQSSKRGDTVVKFTGVWNGTMLRAVTDEVISKPKEIDWEPESFTLSFSEDGTTASYECRAGGATYTAELTAP